MIGVIAKADDRPVVLEFFELFKTPWEEYRSEQSYDVVLICQSGNIPVLPARLVIQYSTSESLVGTEVKSEHRAQMQAQALTCTCKGWRIPIYGVIATFREVENVFLKEETTGQVVGYQRGIQGGTYCHIGYDLFGEIRTLLVKGQPPEQASIPTIELHIAILRDLIIEAGVTFVEVPPIPQGYTFMACLTHDVDHPAMRFHGWDHTMLGFFYRAIWGSLAQWVKGRRSFSYLVNNYVAAVKAPFVFLRLAKDEWRDFRRYQELEGGASSTFYVLPFRGRSGMTVTGTAPAMRASSYGAADIADIVKELQTSGAEIGLHGIDTWIDGAKGEEEKTEIANVAEGRCDGVRMHWLYFQDDSHATLEKAGFIYDSSVGYSQTVGYRAGTIQVYRPLGVKQLLEIPLHVMDTALFYPAHLNLSFEEATKKIGVLIDSTIRFGGALTFNWHDRSIAPERCWGEFYAELVKSLKQKGAWCTSASQTVCWFQSRRAINFKRSGQGIEVVANMPDGGLPRNMPGLWLRMYNAAGMENKKHSAFVDTPIPAQGDLSLVLRMNGWLEARPRISEVHS